MPLRILRPYAAAMPRLEARENLLAVSRLAVVKMREADRSRVLARWRKEAAQTNVPTRVRDAGMLGRLAMASGIGFRTVRPADG